VTSQPEPARQAIGRAGATAVAQPHPATIPLAIAVVGAVGVLIWVVALQTVSPAEINEFGLVAAIPAWAYVGCAVLACAFALALDRSHVAVPLAAGLVAMLILMLYGAPAWIEGVTRLSAAWEHVGVVDLILRGRQAAAAVDPNEAWPGFFALGAFLANVSGIRDLLSVAVWAPVIFSLLYIAPLYAVFRALTTDGRVIWLAIWLFFATNWMGLDYFSPQALGFFVFLVVVAVVLRLLSRHGGPIDLPFGSPRLRPRLTAIANRIGRSGEIPVTSLTRPRRAVILGIILVILAFTATGHALVPLFIAAALAACTVVGVVRWPTLVVALLVTFGAWVAFGGFPATGGGSAVARLSESVAADLTTRLQGSPEHQIVVSLRLATTAIVWLLALAAVVQAAWSRRPTVTVAALAIAPLVLFIAQGYAGDVLVRVALFSLPFVAFLAAQTLLAGVRTRLSTTRLVVVATVVLVSMTSLVVTRYGDERIESFSPAEVAGMTELYRVAPPGSQFVAVVGDLPWKAIRYEDYAYRPTGAETYYGRKDELVAALSSYSAGPSYLILSRAQQAYVETILGQPREAWPNFVTDVMESARFTTVFQNGDITIARFEPDSAQQ